MPLFPNHTNQQLDAGRVALRPGMGGVYDPALLAKYIAMGTRMILSGADLSFLMAGAKARAEFLRAVKR